MQVECLTARDKGEWNAFAAQEPHFGLLQSWEWGEFKEKLGWRPFRVAVKKKGRIVAGAQMLIKSLIPRLASVAYVPRGPIGDWLDTGIADRLLAELHVLARGHRAVFLKIEPPLLDEPAFHQMLEQNGFRISSHTNQPRATLIVNLDQKLDDILGQMRKKTRQYVRKAEREGVTVRIGSRKDLAMFYDIMRFTSRRGHFPHRSRSYYEHEWQIFADNKQAVLLTAVYEGQIQAVRTAHCFGKHAAEFHAGSWDSSADLHANYLLVWEAIKWARAQGCCSYDLWGIPGEIGLTLSEGNSLPVSDRTDGLWGVYRFKTGFSKNLVRYIGAYDYVYVPLLYALIASRLLSADMLDRLAAWMDEFRSNGEKSL
jgi:peptidoglycan pentaglycine glycine transferase (the first glycine)